MIALKICNRETSATRSLRNDVCTDTEIINRSSFLLLATRQTAQSLTSLINQRSSFPPDGSRPVMRLASLQHLIPSPWALETV